MFTLFAFLIVVLGGINWLMIGMLQYDFVAGWFGYQGSIFSRLLYILVGISTLFLIFKVFADKGKINLINFKFSRKKKNNYDEHRYEKLKANIEASNEFDKNRKSDDQIVYNNENFKHKDEISGKDFSESDIQSNFPKYNDESSKNNIFDEMD